MRCASALAISTLSGLLGRVLAACVPCSGYLGVYPDFIGCACSTCVDAAGHADLSSWTAVGIVRAYPPPPPPRARRRRARAARPRATLTARAAAVLCRVRFDGAVL